LAQGPGVFIQLADEATIRLRIHPLRLHVVHSLIPRPAVPGYEVGGDDACASADTLHAVDEDFGVLVPQRVGQEVCRVRQERREFRERRVEQGYLEFADGEVWRDVDGAAHGGEDVGDAERGECGVAFCDIDVGDVEVWEDLGQL